MRCEVCGSGKAKVRRLSRTYGKGADLLVIENVPVVSCPTCGESYLTAETMHELDRLRKHRHSIAKEREVGVVRFEAA